MAITTISDTPRAGTSVTLTCTVISDLPSLITWSGPGGPMLTNSSDVTITQDSSVIEHYDPTANASIGTPRSSRVIAVVRGVSNLTFHPLHASDGAVYTCNSVVNVTSVTSFRRNISQAYSLKVQSK